MVYLGADHAGFRLKEQLKAGLTRRKIAFQDLGAAMRVPGDDYPDIAAVVGRHVVHEHALGVLICGSSFGVCIAANKIKGVRAVAVRSAAEAEIARQHDGANLVCLAGGGYVDPRLRGLRGMSVGQALAIITRFIKTPVSRAARHERRRAKIARLEK